MNRERCIHVFGFLVCLLFSAGQAPGLEVLHVDAESQCIEDCTGETWATAYEHLHSALLRAAQRNNDSDPNNNVDEIWVANGTYTPDPDCEPWECRRRLSLCIPSDVGVYGGFAGDETSRLYCDGGSADGEPCESNDDCRGGGVCRDGRDFLANLTVLSGDIRHDDSFVSCASDEDCSDYGRLCVKATGSDEGSCILPENNHNNSSKVVLLHGTGPATVLDGFTVTAGNASGGEEDEQELNERGGGILIKNARGTIRNCRIIHNAAVTAGGGIGLIEASAPDIVQCTVARNFCPWGGGMGTKDTSSPRIVSCVFLHNVATVGGGAIFLQPGPATIHNTLIAHNRAIGFLATPAAIQGGNIELTSSTIAQNRADGNCGGVSLGIGDNTITNSVIWGNQANDDFGSQLTFQPGEQNIPVLRHNDIQGGWQDTSPPITQQYWELNGNIGEAELNADDPLFVEPEVVDFRIRAGSAVIDRGNNADLPQDDLDVDGDNVTEEQLPIDLGGRKRRWDDPGVADVEGQDAPVVDMGAYEFPCKSAELPVADEAVLDLGYGTRNRYLSFVPGNDGQDVLFRVTAVGLPESCEESCVGRTYWVKGLADPVCELSGEPGVCFPPGGPEFQAATLGDRTQVDYRTWDDPQQVVHVYGIEIVPGGAYTIEAARRSTGARDCDYDSEENYTAPVPIATSKYGNIVGEFNETLPTCTQGEYRDCWTPPGEKGHDEPDFDDIGAAVDKFKNLVGAPAKSRADVLGDATGLPDRKVDFGDIPAVVDGFRKLSYPHACCTQP